MAKPIRKPTDVPGQLAAFFTDELARGDVVRVFLHERSTIATQGVTDWKPDVVDTPEELAKLVWERALSDASQGREGGLVGYAALTQREDGTQARCKFQTPATITGTDAGTLDEPTPEGAIAITMKHLREERAVGSTVLLESIESLKRTYEQQAAGWGKLQDKGEALYANLVRGYEAALEHANKTIDTLRLTNEAAATKQIELVALIEEMHSGKHERDLEFERMRLSEGRKTTLMDEVLIKRALPALATKMGFPTRLLGGGGEGSSGGGTGSASEGGTPADEGLPNFSRPLLIAIGRFFASLREEDIAAVGHALEGAPAHARLAELIGVFADEARAAQAAAEKQDKANGAAAHAQGAVS